MAKKKIKTVLGEDGYDYPITNYELVVDNNGESVKTKFANLTSLPANGGNADTVNGYKIWVGTQTELDAIVIKDADTIYIVKES